MTRAQHLQRIRTTLEKRRESSLQALASTQDELRALKAQGQDSELEENAQAELADFTLSKMMDNQRTEIHAIQGALRRLDEGVFGTCVDCGGEISLERLEALPFALR